MKLERANAAFLEKETLCDKMVNALENFEGELTKRSKQLQIHLDERTNLEHALQYQSEKVNL